MHAFFGNDFMSSFFRKSKVHCWKIMKTSDNSRKHLNYWEILKGVMTLLVFREIYVCKLYGFSDTSVN